MALVCSSRRSASSADRGAAADEPLLDHRLDFTGCPDRAGADDDRPRLAGLGDDGKPVRHGAGFGYIIAGIGPFAASLNRDWSGGWQASAALCVGLGCAAGLLGLSRGRARQVGAPA